MRSRIESVGIGDRPSLASTQASPQPNDRRDPSQHLPKPMQICGTAASGCRFPVLGMLREAGVLRGLVVCGGL
jgi:hypothetical protein